METSKRKQAISADEKAAQVNSSKTVKAGDLVRFYSGFDSFQRAYENRNPGIVLFVKTDAGWGGSQKYGEVMWSDGSVSVEHMPYLQKCGSTD